MDAIHKISNTVIRDNIEGNRLIQAEDSIRAVINSEEFQRLRNIRQMGLSSFVFPTAEHSRFTHSLGVYATAQLFFEHLARRASSLDLQLPGFVFNETTKLEFCVAGLCHDIGHSAFSHVLETVLLPDGMKNHEDCTVALLRGDFDIARKIDAIHADRDAVINLLIKAHPNKALCDLISSTFDVDRCDYVLRDSHMTGVEYGNYDLKWLVHTMTVETNALGQPVLLLDGPRGLDALRQFLDARHHLHRQVYLHPTIRGAQILLKGIFSRIQDLGKNDDTAALSPKCLHPIMHGKKPTFGEFLATTDVEVTYMIRNFAASHSDQTLRLLCQLFLRRSFPKCVLDSAKFRVPFQEKYNIAEYDAGKETAEGSEGVPTLIELTEALRAFIGNQYIRKSMPPEMARYLVSFDPVRFNSDGPSDLLFSFRGRLGPENVPFELINPECVGFDLSALLESFDISRVFVPREFVSEAREYLDLHYGKEEHMMNVESRSEG